MSEPAPGTARLQLTNARLEAFRRSPSCEAATSALVLDPGTSPIVLPGPGGGYGVNVQLLDATTCSVVPDQNAYRYSWESRDPSIVTVDTSFQPPGLGARHADLRSERTGGTSVRVSARHPETEEVVAELDLPVEVGGAAAPPVPTTLPTPAAG